MSELRRPVRHIASLLLFVLLVTLAGVVVADDGAPLSGEPASNNHAPRMLPAVPTSAATKAMMLDSARAGKRIVAVGDHGIVLLSDDDGKNFRQAKTVPVRVTLTSVAFVDDKAGWAVGHWGVILTTSDGGETWHLLRSDTAVDQPLFSVHFKDRNRGWAVGLWSLMLATNDGGKTWNRVKLPPPPGGGKGDRNLLAIFASGKGTLLIAAEQGTIIRSADDGSSWQYISTGYKGSFWTGAALKDGTLLTAGLRGTVYRSGDDGKSWKEVNSGVKSSLTGFAEVNGKIYAVGLDGVHLESCDHGASFKALQREDRTPFTTIVATGSGGLVAFSKGGVVKGFSAEEKVAQKK